MVLLEKMVKRDNIFYFIILIAYIVIIDLYKDNIIISGVYLFIFFCLVGCAIRSIRRDR